MLQKEHINRMEESARTREREREGVQQLNCKNSETKKKPLIQMAAIAFINGTLS